MCLPLSLTFPCVCARAFSKINNENTKKFLKNKVSLDARKLNFDGFQFIYFFGYLFFWCPNDETIGESSVVKILPSVFLVLYCVFIS